MYSSGSIEGASFRSSKPETGVMGRIFNHRNCPSFLGNRHRGRFLSRCFIPDEQHRSPCKDAKRMGHTEGRYPSLRHRHEDAVVMLIQHKTRTAGAHRHRGYCREMEIRPLGQQHQRSLSPGVSSKKRKYCSAAGAVTMPRAAPKTSEHIQGVRQIGCPAPRDEEAHRSCKPGLRSTALAMPAGECGLERYFVRSSSVLREFSLLAVTRIVHACIEFSNPKSPAAVCGPLGHKFFSFFPIFAIVNPF